MAMRRRGMNAKSNNPPWLPVFMTRGEELKRMRAGGRGMGMRRGMNARSFKQPGSLGYMKRGEELGRTLRALMTSCLP